MSTQLKPTPLDPARSIPCYPQLTDKEGPETDCPAEDPPPPPPVNPGTRGRRPEALAPKSQRAQRS